MSPTRDATRPSSALYTALLMYVSIACLAGEALGALVLSSRPYSIHQFIVAATLVYEVKVCILRSDCFKQHSQTIFVVVYCFKSLSISY